MGQSVLGESRISMKCLRYTAFGVLALTYLGGCESNLGVSPYEQLTIMMPQEYPIHAPPEKTWSALADLVRQRPGCRLIASDESNRVVSWTEPVTDTHWQDKQGILRIVTAWVSSANDYSSVKVRRLFFREGRVSRGLPYYLGFEYDLINQLQDRIFSSSGNPCEQVNTEGPKDRAKSGDNR